MADPIGIRSFLDFIRSLDDTTFEQAKNLPDAKVGSSAAFDEMLSFLRDFYTGIEVMNSFADEGGQVVDCVPFRLQPALRGSSEPIPDPPPPGWSMQPSMDAISVNGQLAPGRRDRHGNEAWCSDETIPIRRISLEELVRFESLDHYHDKARVRPGTTLGTDVHEYAIGTLPADNLGGVSYNNIWAPTVGAGQINSISQIWCLAGPVEKAQTVEGGWTVYPARFGTTGPCLFIFFTSDGYKLKKGWNLDGGAFTQTNNNWILGGWLHNSIPNGQQQALLLGWYLWGGCWWCSCGTNSVGYPTWLGYYKASTFLSGQMATKAQLIEFGGEATGLTAWGQMGSGQLAAYGYKLAAYHDKISYFPMSGGASTPALTSYQTHPNWYTVSIGGEYLYFGGPGSGQ